MFREMRRKNQLLSEEAAVEVLERGTSGVLAVQGDDDYPYAVPLSYVYGAGKLYFHSAVAGHKLDAIKRNTRVSFCVIDQDMIVPEKFTTYFRSVIVFGTIRLLEDKKEKQLALMLACPYDVPRYQWEEALPLITKCQLCSDRLKEGELPACVGACPTGTLTYGNREELLRKAHGFQLASPQRELSGSSGPGHLFVGSDLIQLTANRRADVMSAENQHFLQLILPLGGGILRRLRGLYRSDGHQQGKADCRQ